MQDVCPTVTPGAKLWVVKEQRFVTEVEKLLLNMVPVHLLKWPPGLSDRDIHDLAGNTMHLKAVGLAMLIAMSLVEWGPVATEKPRSLELVGVQSGHAKSVHGLRLLRRRHL